MKRRLTIARALVNDPELLLLDEPTTGLDPQARHLLWDRLYRLKREGVTQIVTTHYMDEAEQLCDRLVVMDGGVIVAEGSPSELIGRHSTREVLELRFEPEHQPAAAELEPLVDRVEELPDRLLLYTGDGERAKAAVLERGHRPAAVLVRRSSLEDVFLRLTGRTLVDWMGGNVPALDRTRPRPLGRCALVVEGHWTWYQRNWRATVVSTVVQPLLFLLAFGVGFGSLAHGPGRAATGGIEYLVWLAPALLACRRCRRRRSTRRTRCCPASSGSGSTTR